MSDGAPSVLEARGDAPYAVRLPNFDGPLDLLLHLIRRDELDIFDIPIARLTAAYLGHLELMRGLHLEPASEFLVMAATLLQIKSRSLLPRPPGLDDVGEGVEDPREALVLRLLEYERFQQAALELGDRVRLGWDVFSRPDGLDRPARDDDDPLADHDVYRLAEAFRQLASRGHFEAPHDIYVERVSIAERIAQIADLLGATQRLAFTELCGQARYREEIITTFLALLEMARLKLIRTVQTERLGDLWVEARVGAIGDLGERAAGMLDEPPAG
ncbi:MAG: segregation/condensation protein A [Myxococcales bacterium]|nr:segregation/condensation protein A [Myxococcales bacterium]MCB9523355.1 segregation/condensation protein A [Myxococcales bacterium]